MQEQWKALQDPCTLKIAELRVAPEKRKQQMQYYNQIDMNKSTKKLPEIQLIIKRPFHQKDFDEKSFEIFVLTNLFKYLQQEECFWCYQKSTTSDHIHNWN